MKDSPIPKDVRRTSIDSTISIEVTTPTLKTDEVFHLNSKDDIILPVTQRFISTLTLKGKYISTDSSLSGCGLGTPDSGISLKPNYDPLLALRASLAVKRIETHPPLPLVAPPPPPPEEKAPPPPPEGIENISSDEGDKQPLISPFPVFEEISGDESPVMVYSQLEIEEISSDEGRGSDMEISDVEADVIELNVGQSTKACHPLPPLPPIPPSFPPPPDFFSKFQLPDHTLSYNDTPTTVLSTQNGYSEDKDDIITLHTHSESILQTKFSPVKQWKVPTAITREERRGQNVLFCALEQLSKILLRDVEKKLVESSAYPVLDQLWDKREVSVCKIILNYGPVSSLSSLAVN